MALLKYICNDCGTVFEELVSDGKTPPCPKCKKCSVKRYYRGKCYFGQKGSSKGRGGSCAASCSSCSGCNN